MLFLLVVASSLLMLLSFLSSTQCLIAILIVYSFMLFILSWVVRAEKEACSSLNGQNYWTKTAGLAAAFKSFFIRVYPYFIPK